MADNINKFKTDLEVLQGVLDKVRDKANLTRGTFDSLAELWADMGVATNSSVSALENLAKSYSNFNSISSETVRIMDTLKSKFQSQGQAARPPGQLMLPHTAYRPPQDAFAAIQEGLAEASARRARIESVPLQGARSGSASSSNKYTRYVPPSPYSRVPPEDILNNSAPPAVIQGGPGDAYEKAQDARYERMREKMKAFTRFQKQELAEWNKALKESSKSKPIEIDIESQAKKFPEVTKAIEEYGMKMEHLKGVSTEVSTGISTLNFATQDADGTFRKLNVTVDQNGKILQDSQKRFRGFASTIGRNIAEALKWSIAIQLVWGPLKKLNDLV